MKCVRCERPMRGHRDSVEDNPGTVRVGRDGRCRSCWRVASSDPVRPVFDLVQSRSALEGYLVARRRRVGPE